MFWDAIKGPKDFDKEIVVYHALQTIFELKLISVVSVLRLFCRQFKVAGDATEKVLKINTSFNRMLRTSSNSYKR